MPSQRVLNISVSPTMKIAAKAIALKKENADLVDLSVGEPDFPTPTAIKEAAKEAIDRNLTRYTLNQGIWELREAIAKRLRHDYQVQYHPDEIIVSNGAKQSIYNVIQSIVNAGDEVIIPAPFYPSYAEMVKLCAGTPVIVPTSEISQFKLTPDLLSAYLSDKTVALVLCNPSNPTGIVYDQDELARLFEIISDREIYIISDEVYAGLVYDHINFVSAATVNPAIKDKTIIVSGVSKSYAMTGWRIGFAAGPRDIIENANKIQSHSTSNACTISQYASLAALSGSQNVVDEMRQVYQKRRNFILEKISMIPDVHCIKPGGAFYVFPNIRNYFGRQYKKYHISDCEDLALYLLSEAKVVVVPGSAFGAPDNIRICYANSMENLSEGMDRIRAAL